jgi:D-alanyl-lipoteichoic acid acyltransferase DltB (MBOAT superfamily)
VLTFFDPLVAALFIPLAGIAIWLQKGWKGGFMTQALLMFAVSFAYVGFSGTIPPAHTLVFLTPFVIMAVSEGLYNGYTQVSQIYRKGMMVLIALLPILVLVNSNRTMYRTNLHPATQEALPWRQQARAQRQDHQLYRPNSNPYLLIPNEYSKAIHSHPCI